MCDTLYAPPSSTTNRVSLFAKNSDRQRNEAQGIEYTPAAIHQEGTSRTCTYIGVPQVGRTYATLIARPFWMWGAEMGANEYGVVIGNEGLHARIPAPETPALTGMDLVRLALERARTAAEAMEVLTNLLERFGQGGNCGHRTANYYNNGFLIIDADDAYVIETVGREWLVERPVGVRTLSNIYSIQNDPFSMSEGLRCLVEASGWSNDAVVRYDRAITNPDREHIGNANARRTRSASLLAARANNLCIEDMMKTLRDHGSDGCNIDSWDPEGSTQISVCMHAGDEERSGQTVGSWVSEVTGQGAVHWVTASAAPCISIFKPLFVDAAIPSDKTPLTDRFAPSSRWWRHELLHRRSLPSGLPKLIREIEEERRELEASFRRRIEVVKGATRQDRSEVVARCWRDADLAEARWQALLQSAPAARATAYEKEWTKMNQEAHIEVATGG